MPPTDVNQWTKHWSIEFRGGGGEEVKFLWKFKKKWGGVVRVDVYREVNCFENSFFLGGGGSGLVGGGGGGGGGQGRCEQRIEVFVKIQKQRIMIWIFFQFFIKYSIHHLLSADKSFKFIAIILFEIWHLQNFILMFVKGP